MTWASRDFRCERAVGTLALAARGASPHGLQGLGHGLLAAVWLMSAACASTGAVPRPFPTPTTLSRGGSYRSADRYGVAGTALALRGAPYKNGGADPNGFDCSGFTWYVFGQHGVVLPRDVHDQFRIGKAIKPNHLAAGDLIFFSTVAPGASHVAIAIGGDEFVHAPSSTGIVRVERLTAGYWLPRFVGARRID